MFDGEVVTLWKDRTPPATIFGFLLSTAGIVMLYLSKRALTLENIRSTRGYFEKRKTSILNRLDKTLIYLSAAFGCLSVLVLLFGVISSGDFRARLFRHKGFRLIGIVIAALLAICTCALICWWMNYFEYYTQYYYYGRCAEYECTLKSYTKLGFVKKCMNMMITNLILDEEETPQDFTLCDDYDMFRYCELYLPLLETHFLKIYFSFCVILCGHTIYCMCMAGNYIKIRCQAKFEELEELRSLELSSYSSDLD